jgi:hypothetical protein
MDCYMWVDTSTGKSLMIPISDASETYVKNELPDIEEATNTSLLPARQAYVTPETGANFTRMLTLISTVCSHDDIDHETCVDDPDCDEKIRLLSQLPTRKKKH